MLFDKLERPNFAGMLTSEAWEEWAYDNADSFSEDGWDDIVRTIHDNRNRYYAKYEE